MAKFVIGIDPGKKGGIAFINAENPQEANVIKMPSFDDLLIGLLASHKDQILICFVEKQWAFPKQGVTSSFNFGVSYGKLLGILQTLQIPYEEIPSLRWQTYWFGKVKNGKRPNRKKTKELSLKKAKALFPKLQIKTDGESDALLIAEFGRRFFIVNQAGRAEKNAE